MGTPSDAKPIIGYCDPWSVAAGQSVDFMISCRADTFDAQIVRLRHGDRTPGGPGERYVEIPHEANGSYPGRYQPLTLGSYALVPAAFADDLAGGMSITAWVYATTATPRLQGVFTSWSEDASGFGLFLEDCRATLKVNKHSFSVPRPLRLNEWTFVAVTWNSITGQASIQQRPLAALPDDPSNTTTLASIRATVQRHATAVIGGHLHADNTAAGTFNGKIDSPRIYGRAHSLDDLWVHRDDPEALPNLIGSWDFVTDSDSDHIRSTSPAPDGIAVNHPTRGVTGRNWSGTETVFFRAPQQYNALYFHADDLYDARWSPTFTVRVPEGMDSGIYAVKLACAAGYDMIPFFVRPRVNQPTAPIAFLAPTLSYLAYANEHSAEVVHSEHADFDIRDQYTAEDRFAISVPLSGLYDLHPDGTGHCYSSWRKPIVSMRPYYHLPVSRSAHQLSADLHIIDWLEAKGFRHDVITDHDLHDDGMRLLSGYSVVVTGSHPEYWTLQMLDSIDEYLAAGGRLIYMGGNGFYWVTSISRSRPHLIEVRRGRRGTASWQNAPGEDYHSTSHELGGLWRDRGRAPQRLVGIGMTAQGFGTGRGYRRTRESYCPDVSWIFDGVPGDEIGSDGLVLGAAAGFEFDRADTTLGTPVNATVVAVADGFTDEYQHVVEEVQTSDSKQGGSVNPLVRADMVYFRRANGGAVFSTGSIAFGGALSNKHYDNAASRVIENVLNRFLSSQTRK